MRNTKTEITEMKRGKHIVLEGMDFSGKSTLAALVGEQLLATGSRTVRTIRFPSDGPIGSMIRAVLYGRTEIDRKALLYLFTADGVDQRSLIERWIAAGHHVICDRHPCLSGWVYQRQEHPLRSIEAVHHTAPLAQYDKLFVIDLPAKDALARQRSREKERDVVYEYELEDPQALIRVRTMRELYLQLAEDHKATILDGRLPAAVLVDQIIEEMNT